MEESDRRNNTSTPIIAFRNYSPVLRRVHLCQSRSISGSTCHIHSEVRPKKKREVEIYKNSEAKGKTKSLNSPPPNYLLILDETGASSSCPTLSLSTQLAVRACLRAVSGESKWYTRPGCRRIKLLGSPHEAGKISYFLSGSKANLTYQARRYQRSQGMRVSVRFEDAEQDDSPLLALDEPLYCVRHSERHGEMIRTRRADESAL